MSEPFARLRRFFAELKRRSVYQVAVAYAVVGFVLIESASLIFPALNIPSWAYSLVVVLVLFGFPIALVIAWAFELTPEGVRRTPTAGQPMGPERIAAEEAGPSTQTRHSRSRRAVGALVGLGLIGAAVTGGWYLVGGGGATISDRSVAVLPFQTIGDTASDPFTEGLHNDLLTRLQRVSDLTVIARPSVMRYEDTDQPLEQVAEELNARWIVSATVQQSGGNQVQVHPRLIDPRTGTERWSDSYRGELEADQVFALQEEITRSVADALEAELATGERERVERQPTGDLEAYRLYVRGRQQFARRSGACPSCVFEAVRLFRRAIERDSTFALAWTGLADAAVVFPSEVPDSLVAPDVEPEFAARRALELDPDLAEAHASMGHVHLRDMNAPAARRELERAIDLKPSYWEAHHWLGELYLQIGRAEQALEHLEFAVELNPQHALARHLLYDAYLATGQTERSLEEVRLQQRLGLEETSAVGGEIRALYHLGRFDEARRLAEKEIAGLEEGAPWREWLRAYLGVIEAAAGDTTRAREMLDQLQSPSARSWVYSALGEADRVFEALEQIDQNAWQDLGTSLSVRNGIHFDLELVRGDPRYDALIREANRAWGLNPDGSFPSESTPPTDD